MNYLKYDTLMNSDATVFEFITKDNITKAVAYQATKYPDIFNLGFGNLIYNKAEDEYMIDDKTVDNNGDIREILATVAQTAYEFSKVHPDSKIFITGSDKRRTNTYKRAIMLNFNELSETFDIFGAVFDGENDITDAPFDYKQNFDGFLFKRKSYDK